VTFDRKLTRRQLLKAGASTAVLAIAGCGSGGEAPAADDETITGAAIHPAIGVARIGNSAGESYLGPELPGALPLAPGGFKDASGAIKRQAARFRVYGVNGRGQVVRELTADEAEITWRVHLRNAKPAWYAFATALDIPEARPAPRRNASFRGPDRALLAIDPGERSISGRAAGGVSFDTGSFLDSAVDLGELRTDDAGRLLVLGGKGRSFSPLATPLSTFANNEGWCDDVADGPVTAAVRLGGRDLPVEPAWVIVAPPNYAPSMSAGFRTLYDVIAQTMVDLGRLAPPGSVSFLADVFPLFDRLAQLQWVNQGILQRFGWKSPEDFLDPDFLRALADPSPANAAFRQSLFARFRNPDFAVEEPDALPPIYGDAVAIPAVSPRNWLAVTEVQFDNLARWAAGDFVDDLEIEQAPPEALEDLPVAAQPAALDRAALEACLGDAFHPGCEATWPMRIGSMYAGLFRLRHRRGAESDFGDQLTPAVALSSRGPLAGSGPGDVTRWMAVPWQTDTASCRSGYEPAIDPFLPTFWAARVPNHVLTEAGYARVVDTTLPLAQRQQAFAERAAFYRALDRPNYVDTLRRMVDNWYRLGLVTEKPGPADGEFPAVMKVETDNDLPE
jgi:hypothetical protein